MYIQYIYLRFHLAVIKLFFHIFQKLYTRIHFTRIMESFPFEKFLCHWFCMGFLARMRRKSHSDGFLLSVFLKVMTISIIILRTTAYRLIWCTPTPARILWPRNFQHWRSKSIEEKQFFFIHIFRQLLRRAGRRDDYINEYGKEIVSWASRRALCVYNFHHIYKYRVWLMERYLCIFICR